MNSRQFAILMMLGAIWGGSFLCIRVAVSSFGPSLLMVIRVSLAGIALAIYAGITHQHQSAIFRSHWRELVVLGALNAAIPFTLIIRPGGEVVFRHTGIIDPLEVKRIIVKNLARDRR